MKAYGWKEADLMHVPSASSSWFESKVLDYDRTIPDAVRERFGDWARESGEAAWYNEANTTYNRRPRASTEAIVRYQKSRSRAIEHCSPDTTKPWALPHDAVHKVSPRQLCMSRWLEEQDVASDVQRIGLVIPYKGRLDLFEHSWSSIARSLVEFVKRRSNWRINVVD